MHCAHRPSHPASKLPLALHNRVPSEEALGSLGPCFHSLCLCPLPCHHAPIQASHPRLLFISLASHLSCLAGKTWLHWSTEQPPWTCQRGVLDVGWQWGSPPRPLQASQGAVCRPSTCSHPAMPSMAPAWHMKSCSWCPHHSSSASTPSSQPCLRY